ncbi:uroporphyrinogen-III synthase [Candidatus Chloroploca sp. M-50]|uniref:Uroporphyrinogen-III synthase n=1 Tax=Candidatus Chloroploca mongolica TaxID=2528176 RepID=A0ABS4DED6_9CHLR|nr:uroporphyrinogen-III synthase [Candidatus Chloroploca mongolica]MBP1467790.1 uroporphyrinogen-III synthase [Candidatus Chloroploca mongolica]
MSVAQPMPLDGVRVLVTRAAERSDGLVQRLHNLGAIPVVRPTIAYGPPAEPALLADALTRLVAGAYHWLLLTSVTTVEAVASGLGDQVVQLRAQPLLQIGAVGPATAEACQRFLGVTPAAMPERFLGEELAGVIGELAGLHVLLPNADLSRPVLEERLRAAGAIVDRVIAYRTIPAPGGDELAGLLEAGQLDVILFTSGSTARYFVQQIGTNGLDAARHTTIICIGPATADVCRELTLTPAAVADPYTEEGLITALLDIKSRVFR